MVLRQYFPISVGFFVLVVVLARHFAVPVVPFAVATLVGETLVGVQLEDNKIAHLVGGLLKSLKSNPHQH
jgi:hypothetical protein